MSALQASVPQSNGSNTGRRVRRAGLSPDVSEVLRMLEAYEEAGSDPRR